jgi:hypothetical protein
MARNAERLRAVSTKFAYWLNLQLYVARCSLGYRVRGDAISAVGATETLSALHNCKESVSGYEE